MAETNPYTIHIPDSKLKRLQQKLELTDFPTYELEDAGWKYGTPLYSSHPPSTPLNRQLAPSDPPSKPYTNTGSPNSPGEKKKPK